MVMCSVSNSEVRVPGCLFELTCSSAKAGEKRYRRPARSSMFLTPKGMTPLACCTALSLVKRATEHWRLTNPTELAFINLVFFSRDITSSPRTKPSCPLWHPALTYPRGWISQHLLADTPGLLRWEKPCMLSRSGASTLPAAVGIPSHLRTVKSRPWSIDWNTADHIPCPSNSCKGRDRRAFYRPGGA